MAGPGAAGATLSTWPEPAGPEVSSHLSTARSQRLPGADRGKPGALAAAGTDAGLWLLLQKTFVL